MLQSAVSLFQAQGIRSKRKSCSDTAVVLPEVPGALENPRKDEEGQEKEEVTEETNTIHDSRNGKGGFLFEEALLVFKA